MSGRLVCLAAGGTGGHLFPAEALGQALLARGHRVLLLTDERGLARHPNLPEAVALPAARMGAGLMGKVRGALDGMRGFVQARRRFAGDRPAAFVGFGGYPTLAPGFAAAAARLPIVLHDPNAILGRANRALAGKARAIATALPKVERIPAGAARIVQVGNPVRPVFDAVQGLAYAAPGADGPLRLLVLGGSQGARLFSTLVPPAILALPDGLRQRLDLTQQVRAEDLDQVRAAYAAGGMAPTLAPFFDDVPVRMAAAHLFVGRSGASTVAELTLIGRPALFIPFAAAADDHQVANARVLEAAGAASILLEADAAPALLSTRLAALLADPTRLTRQGAAARALGQPAAAARLADLVEEVMA